jgi:hypothetical protein
MTKMDQGLCTGEEEDAPPVSRGTSTELDLGGLALFSGMLALEGLGRHPS